MDEWAKEALVELLIQSRKVAIRTSILLVVCGLALGLLIGLTFGAV